MFHRCLFSYICYFFFLFGIQTTFASLNSNSSSNPWETHPLYVGVSIGYGDTDWSQLTAKYNTESEFTLLSLSTPLSAGDKGVMYGADIGYDITSHFALETNYMRFPDTTVTFDPSSLYAIENGVQSMVSKTYAINLIGKVMVPLGNTAIRGFADAGPGLVHRDDPLVDAGHICPTFGVGLDYTFHNHFTLSLAFQYYAGFGRATLRPALDYTPFLYTFYTNLAYRF